MYYFNFVNSSFGSESKQQLIDLIGTCTQWLNKPMDLDRVGNFLTVESGLKLSNTDDVHAIIQRVETNIELSRAILGDKYAIF